MPGRTGPITGHEFAAQDNFLAAADRTTALSGAAFRPIQCWMFVSGVDVRASTARYTGTVVTLGDSITTGRGWVWCRHGR